MSSILLGEVIGDTCGHCLEPLELEGEFYAGSEVECGSCGAALEIATVAATYTVTIRVLEDGRGEKVKPA